MSRSYKRYPKVKQERLTKSDKIILILALKFYLNYYEYYALRKQYAGIVQRIVCQTSNLEMRVRFPLPAFNEMKGDYYVTMAMQTETI